MKKIILRHLWIRIQNIYLNIYQLSDLLDVQYHLYIVYFTFYLYPYLYFLFQFMLYSYFYFAQSIWNKNNFPPVINKVF